MEKTILKEILDLIKRPASSELLAHVCDQASLVIPCYPTTNNANTLATTDGKYGVLPPLASFIGFMVKRASVRVGTLLGCLVFLQRLQQTLFHVAKGMPCTSYRIFLATLIVTSKSLHDTSPKNKHWARYASYFTLPEINLMEKQLLSLLNYHVIISPSDLANVYIRFKKSCLSPTIQSPVFMKPVPAVLTSTHTNDIDMPSYAALYSHSNKKFSLSNTSLSSTESDSSVDTLTDEQTTQHYFAQSMEDKLPPKVHCKSRKPFLVNILLYDKDSN
ncbi:uncharacterized protein B0P05DRAFT_573363 [Gilbertella persicaria]|uniref:Cyclin N-terminal domain-containing protein n=1 Tax=Rhizopus stolonifer TaxID=4846 RepID=A0A367IMH7_RHIST|nr:uncharacterized protein B0P05DRAFT_573363 [Gilbertella persicaria]KAI8070658.1 hypothetical protein B0P05DRAFT_573363 [Gilbertella persicaria]RCH78843.1 hypothetical protein CU098_005658 [Rhizopus stolonifer]